MVSCRVRDGVGVHVAAAVKAVVVFAAGGRHICDPRVTSLACRWSMRSGRALSYPTSHRRCSFMQSVGACARVRASTVSSAYVHMHRGTGVRTMAAYGDAPPGRRIMKLLFQVHGEMLFGSGIVNADPHAGNILIKPDQTIGPWAHTLRVVGLVGDR
jgi:hypothetical protein